MPRKEMTLDKLRANRDKAQKLFDAKRKEIEAEIKETFELKYFYLVLGKLENLRSRILAIEFMVSNNITEESPIKMRELLENLKDKETPVWKTHLFSCGYSDTFNPNNLGILGSRGKKPGYYIDDIEKAKKWLNIAKKIIEV